MNEDLAKDDELPDAGHIEALDENLDDVEDLVAMHHHIREDARECSHDVEVLHRSAVVLLCACWEAFVEDLAKASLESLLAEGKSPEVLPKNVRTIVGKAHPGLDAWKLAGDGWKRQMRGHLTGVLGQTVGRLNTPKAGQVDKLFEEVTGFNQLSSTWRWRGMSSARAIERVDQLVSVRGDIAHRVRRDDRVTRGYVETHIPFVRRLACTSSNALAGHIEALTGGPAPWAHYHVGDADDGAETPGDGS